MTDAPIRLPEPGDRFAGHEILRRVGEGAMGVVYAARNGLPQAVAMKVLKPDRAASERYLREFLDEAAATGAVGHENVVRILGGGEERGLYYFLMELVDGPPLSRFVEQGRRLPWKEATRILIQVAKALDAAHAKGLIHRDVKPDNILLYRDGRARLTDFGIVKDISTLKGYLVPGRPVGTAAYASPEQCLQKRLSPATDMYSLGATFYALLCGRPPFSGSTRSEVMMKHVRCAPRSPNEIVPDLPKALARTIIKMMAKRQADRPESMEGLVRALETILEGRVLIGGGGGRSPRARRRRA